MTLALGQPVWLVYAIVGALVYLESAVVLGVVLPGETAALVGGVAVTLGDTSLGATAAVVVVAALLGDTTAFLLGRSAGSRLLSVRVLRRVRGRVEGAAASLARRGGASLVAARFTPVARTVAPMLAGSGGMPYRTFLRWNGLGVVAWGVTCVVLGALAGQSWAQVSGWVGSAVTAVVGTGVMLWVVVKVVRGRRARRVPAATSAEERVAAPAATGAGVPALAS